MSNKISIALCTFNGSRYLKDQLTSFLWQTRLPDEVIICDDGSSDETIDIIKTFSKSSPFTVNFYQNNNHLGPTKNFEKAIKLCTGDLVALSDQDDVWQPQKLERCEDLLDKKPDVGAVFTDAEVTDESLRSLGYRMWEKTNFTSWEQRVVRNGDCLTVLLKHYVVTGATLVFRSHFKSVILPIPGCWFHDAWIALIISALNLLDFIAEPLITYRQHSGNHLGGREKWIGKQVLEALRINRDEYFSLEVSKYETAYSRLAHLPNSIQFSENLSLIRQKIGHLKRRSSMPKNRLLRIPSICSEFRDAGYSRYARNWGSLALDLLFK